MHIQIKCFIEINQKMSLLYKSFKNFKVGDEIYISIPSKISKSNETNYAKYKFIVTNRDIKYYKMFTVLNSSKSITSYKFINDWKHYIFFELNSRISRIDNGLKINIIDVDPFWGIFQKLNIIDIIIEYIDLNIEILKSINSIQNKAVNIYYGINSLFESKKLNFIELIKYLEDEIDFFDSFVIDIENNIEYSKRLYSKCKAKLNTNKIDITNSFLYTINLYLDHSRYKKQIDFKKKIIEIDRFKSLINNFIEIKEIIKDMLKFKMLLTSNRTNLDIALSIYIKIYVMPSIYNLNEILNKPIIEINQSDTDNTLLEPDKILSIKKNIEFTKQQILPILYNLNRIVKNNSLFNY